MASEVSFWAVELAPGNVAAEVTPPADTVLHITQAALAADAADADRVTVVCSTDDAKDVVICHLRGDSIPQWNTDLLFPGGKKVRFQLRGARKVALTGWLQPFDDEPQYPSDFEDDDEDSEELDADLAEEQIAQKLAARKRKAGGMEEDEDSEDEMSFLEGALDDSEDEESPAKPKANQKKQQGKEKKQESKQQESKKPEAKKQGKESKQQESKQETKQQQPAKKAKAEAKTEAKSDNKGKAAGKKEENDGIVRYPNGLQFMDLKVGSGPEVKAGQRIAMRYTGTLTNGKIFDSNARGGSPFVFRLGGGEVIKGWDLGVAGMRVGGKRKLVIPPKLGYGASGTGPIPGNATLVFEVEVVGTK